jgi:hypothetical protein
LWLLTEKSSFQGLSLTLQVTVTKLLDFTLNLILATKVQMFQVLLPPKGSSAVTTITSCRRSSLLES